MVLSWHLRECGVIQMHKIQEEKSEDYFFKSSAGSFVGTLGALGIIHKIDNEIFNELLSNVLFAIGILALASTIIVIFMMINTEINNRNTKSTK